MKDIEKQNKKKSLIHLFLVRLVICTDGSETKKTQTYSFFFSNKNKMSFSLVSDILFMRVGYRRQVKWILIFVKLALCLWLENMKRVSINIPHVRTQRIPPIEIFESFKYFITPCIPILKKMNKPVCKLYC